MNFPLETLPSEDDFLSLLDSVTLSVAATLKKQWVECKKRADQGLPHDRLLRKFWVELERGQRVLQAKIALAPSVTFPLGLPISHRVEDLKAALGAHQVIIVGGETGSGKTTQIPKVCLQLGRGLKGKIGHTQPRRIAATTVATRIAQELEQSLGPVVGYQVRFSDQCEPTTHIKLMTDGILLAEIQTDPLLLQYDTLIVDEAHERSLNIDFLLGYLKQLLPKRADLKLIITSATIDLERFSKHFNNAPIIEVSGRTYPVDILYRPPVDSDGALDGQVLEAIEEILTLPHARSGDILVFLAGEKDIREVAHRIRKAQLPHLEVLPLYARLSLSDQAKVFAPHKGRRVVLATNVAETSITVPGIGYVIDPGFARVSRYSARTKIQRLPVEPISQASANQRAGRCGRVSNGVCIRLYAEEDFLSRPEFTDAEILRTNLASVVLQMLHMGFGDIQRFPFVDTPDSRLVRDGYKLLEELQAVNAKGRLTSLGKRLAALPLDPRMASMLIAADEWGALTEVLIIAAGLTVQDPRERPAEKQQAADEKHRRFKDEHSDFVTWLNLWRYVEEQRQTLSQNQWRKQCSKEFLNFMRLREWRDLHHQMRLAAKNLGLKENREPANYEAVHRALLSGLLSQVAQKSEEKADYDYLGTRNRKLSIFPGSGQFKKKPQWMMSAEVIETSKVFAHTVARIDPKWLLTTGKHLLKHHYFEPHYNAKTGIVMAYDRVTLLGLVISEKQSVNYGKIDSKVAREVFIRAALVEGAYAKAKPKPGAFFLKNQKIIAEIEALEAKSRRRDILVNEESLFEFYQERVPKDIVNLAGFEHWRKTAEKSQPALLEVPKERLMMHHAEGITQAQFPNSLEIEGMTFALTYHFEPGHEDDGVSIGIPVDVLHSFPEHRLDWVVPGLLRDKCIALVKALPKQWRKRFVPVPDYVDRALAELTPSNKPLTESLGVALQRILGESLPENLWADTYVDDFYRFNIHVLDDKGKVLARDRNLTMLRQKYKAALQTTLQNVGATLEKTELTQWDFGVLEQEVSLDRGSITVKAFPALQCEPSGVALRLLDNPLDAEYQSRRGITELALLQLKSTVKTLQKQLLKNKDLGLSVVNLGSRQQVVDDIIRGAVRNCCFFDQIPRDQKAFEARLKRASSVVAEALEMENLLLEALSQVVEIRKIMKTHKSALALTFTFSDIHQQMANLFYPGLFFDTKMTCLRQYNRYLSAIVMRLEKAPLSPQKDRQSIAVLAKCWQLHTQKLEKLGARTYALDLDWQHYRWMVEEFRVSIFAQNLKTQFPVSEKRLQKQWDKVEGRC